MDKDRTSWSVKDEAVCTELVALIGLSDHEAKLLGGLRGEAEKVAPDMVKEFHGRLAGHDHTKQYFESTDMSRVGTQVAAWFVDLFGGVYDQGYAKKRLVIGQTHVRIGLPVRYPLAMLDIVGAHAERVCEKASDPAAARAAFRKILALDVAVFNQSYEDNQLKHLAGLVGGERLARRLIAGE